MDGLSAGVAVAVDSADGGGGTEVGVVVGEAEVGVFVGIDEGGVTVGVGVAVGATVVGVVPTSLVHATLNSKRGAARATDRFLVEKNIDAFISVQYVGKRGLDIP